MILTFLLFIFGFIACLGFIMIVAHCIAKSQQNSEFQKNPEPGTLCFCFMDYDKIPYFIRKVEGCVVTIEDEEGNLLDVGKDQLYV